MKKNVFVLSLLALLLIFSACTKKSSVGQNQSTANNQSPTNGVDYNNAPRHPSIDDTIWVYFPYESDSVFGGWIAYDEDSNYVFFGHTDFAQYYLRFNKTTSLIETDLPESDGSIKCRCEWCDVSGTFSWVICYSVSTCSACCDKFCTANKVLSGS